VRTEISRAISVLGERTRRARVLSRSEWAAWAHCTLPTFPWDSAVAERGHHVVAVHGHAEIGLVDRVHGATDITTGEEHEGAPSGAAGAASAREELELLPAAQVCITPLCKGRRPKAWGPRASAHNVHIMRTPGLA
jgi:hypothetical protein